MRKITSSEGGMVNLRLGGVLARGGLVEYVRTELFPKIRFEMERRICRGM